jgi:hypothetical protein
MAAVDKQSPSVASAVAGTTVSKPSTARPVLGFTNDKLFGHLGLACEAQRDRAADRSAATVIQPRIRCERGGGGASQKSTDKRRNARPKSSPAITERTTQADAATARSSAQVTTGGHQIPLLRTMGRTRLLQVVDPRSRVLDMPSRQLPSPLQPGRTPGSGSHFSSARASRSTDPA